MEIEKEVFMKKLLISLLVFAGIIQCPVRGQYFNHHFGNPSNIRPIGVPGLYSNPQCPEGCCKYSDGSVFPAYSDGSCASTATCTACS